MDKKFMAQAINIAERGIKSGHGPFGAVVVKGYEVVGVGNNQVTKYLDPTAHAEICAIRDACKNLGDFSLSGCEIYTSCEPCPMCLGAIYWARMDTIFFAADRHDAQNANFDDHNFYEELNKSLEKRSIPMRQMMRQESLVVFDLWRACENKILY